LTIKKTYGNSLNLFSLMLIATVPYVGKQLHLDPDPKLITDPDPHMQIISDPAGSGSTTLLAKAGKGTERPTAST
jgi:hypothetical protein